jgi:hypothetical protein
MGMVLIKRIEEGIKKTEWGDWLYGAKRRQK